MKAGRASTTALLIARSTVVASGNPGWARFLDPRAVRICERFVSDHMALGALRLGVYRTRVYRKLLAAMEHLTLPGLQLHYVLRKRLIEEQVRSALKQGFRNVQVAGAGFDTLAVRLARDHEGARFEEVDHPATQQAKKESLQSIGDVPRNLSFSAHDLDSGLDGVDPGAEGLDAGADTIVVAEGVLMYLSEASARRFFARLRQRFKARLRVVFTFMAPDAGGRVRFHDSSRLVDFWLGMKGEPFSWGIEPSGMDGFLKDAGFELAALLGHEEFRHRYLADWPGVAPDLAAGEWLAVAEAIP